MCRYVCLYCSAYVHWFFHRNKSQAMLLHEAEHYYLFTLSHLCLSSNIFPLEWRWALWKGRHFYVISIHISLLYSSFLPLPSHLPSYTIPFFWSYILTSWFVETFLKPQDSIFPKPSSCPDRDISTLPDFPEIRWLMNTCLLEVSESLPTERRHTISQSVPNSQVHA